VIGGILAFIAATWLRDEFLSPRVSAAVVTAWVVVGLTSILIAASLVPAREARRTQPAPLLRED
jgi:ABC-type lipoprotein release transport system permease subunit